MASESDTSGQSSKALELIEPHTSRNYVPDLIEFTIAASKTDDAIWLQAIMRAGIEVVYHESISFEVRIKKARVHLEMSGFKLSNAGRLGDNKPVDTNVTTTETYETKTTKAFNASLATSLTDIPVVKAAGEGKVELTHKRTVSSEHKETSSPIKALPNACWEVLPAGSATTLEGLVLDHRLCDLTEVKGANSQTIKAMVSVYQKDLAFNVEKKSLWKSFSLTDAKLAQIFLTKKMSNQQSPYTGQIVLSEAELEKE